MKINKVVTFLCFAWIPVFAALMIGAEASAGTITGPLFETAVQKDSLSGEFNHNLARRFSPTRYTYPSDVIGKEVPLVYGAYQGRASNEVSSVTKGFHELVVSAHDQGDLNHDGRDEAIMLVEESLCSVSECKIVRHLDIWTQQAGDIIRTGRIPVSTQLDLESVGIQIRQNAILLTMVDIDAKGDLREISETWKMASHAPMLVETKIGELIDDSDGGC